MAISLQNGTDAGVLQPYPAKGWAGHVETVVRFVQDESGADFVEYAFIVAIISIATATLITPLVPTIIAVFDALASRVKP